MKIKKLTEREILESTPAEELEEIKAIFEEEKVSENKKSKPL